MTFIASIVAKDGIAVIADSLVSNMSRVINQKDWLDFLQEKNAANPGEDIKLTQEEITKLFKRRPSHTKNYEEKLFLYDEHTLITTAGAASINNKKILKIISEIKNKISFEEKDKSKSKQTIEEKIEVFCNYLEEDIKEHLTKFGSIQTTIFIISHLDIENDKPHIYKITVQPNEKSALLLDKTVFTVRELQETVVTCDGQYGITDRILYGGIHDAIDGLFIMADVIKSELEKINIRESIEIPANFFSNLKNQQVKQAVQRKRKDAYISQLSDLSLQQASDLAYLLLMVERDLQAYTTPIPTVGGVIKLATITKKGITYILGNNIIKPTRHL